MAKQEEEVVLSFSIEQGDAIAELERTKKSIIQLQQEQRELNDAYKKGNATLEEYASETVRLEALLKRQQSTYSNVQKSVTGVKTQMDKLITSNEKISKDLQKTATSFQEAANKINVAGVSIGDLTGKIASFSNPATAVIGVATALGAAYAASARGAEDLARAQDLLSASSTVLSNKLFSGTGGQFSANSIVNKLLRFGPTAPAAALVKGIFGEELNEIDKLADALKRLRILELIDLKEAQAIAKDNLKIAEQNRRYRDDEEKSLENRLSAANDVEGSINAFEAALLKVQQDRLAAAELIAKFSNNDLQSQVLIKDIVREIADIQEDAEGKRTEAKNGVLAIEKLISQELLLQRSLRTAGTTDPVGGTSDIQAIKTKEEGSALGAVNAEAVQMNAMVTLARATETFNNHIANSKKERSEKEIAYARDTAAAEIGAAIEVSQAVAGLAAEGSDIQKVFALTAIGLDTAAALTGGIRASQNLPYPGNLVAMASTIATILGNIAAAKQYINAAAGGGEFMTKGPTMLMVGDNPGGVERVTVEPISGRGKTTVDPRSNLIKMAGGGTLTAGDPGGMISGSMVYETNQNLITANAIKAMPTPEVSVKEITKKQNRIKIREKTATLR